jgi:hypothetical protein
MEFDAYRLIDPDTNQRVYGEFMSADFAWDYVVCTTFVTIWALANRTGT